MKTGRESKNFWPFPTVERRGGGGGGGEGGGNKEVVTEIAPFIGENKRS